MFWLTGECSREPSCYYANSIDGVMVIMLTSSVVDRGASPSQVNPKTIKLVFVVSLISMQH
jgi:hypothetical protein